MRQRTCREGGRAETARAGAVTDRHVLSLGAGVQSTALLLMALDGMDGLRFDFAVFADTQDEPAAVYQHLDWLRAQAAGRIPIITRSKGDIRAHVMQGENTTGQRFVSIPAYTAPSGSVEAVGQLRRQCTKEFKTEVVRRAVREDILALRRGQRQPSDMVVHMYFGISLEEAHRSVGVLKRWRAPRFICHFPFLEGRGMTRADCHRFNESRVPHRVPRSACRICPYRSDAEWLDMKLNAPDDFESACLADERLREPGTMVHRRHDQLVYLHPLAKPLRSVVLRGEGQGKFPAFVRECEGMCGT